jgi:hypothetical protein
MSARNRWAWCAAAAVGAFLGMGAASSRFLTRARPATPPAAGPAFTDVTAASGVRFTFQREPVNIRQTVAPGVALWDYDGDGILDLFLVGQEGATEGGGGRLYRGHGDGTFEDVTARSGLGIRGPWMGCAVGDVDGDGHPDLLLTGFGDLRLFRNRGDGTFADSTHGSGLEVTSALAWSTSAGFADVNHDGKLDLLVGRYARYDGAVGKAKWWSPGSYPSQQPSLYLGTGGGRFQDVTQAWGLGASKGKTLGVAFADANGDGYPDVYLANDEMPCELWVNEGGRRFRERGTASGLAYNYNGSTQAGMGTDWGDVNGDGKLDLIVTNFEAEPFSLYLNDGDGFFKHVSYQMGIAEVTTPYVGWGAKFLDYDNDGVLDLFFANGHVRPHPEKGGSQTAYEQPLMLFHGGGGRFQLVELAASGLGGPVSARGVAVGDIDNDGRADVVAASVAGPCRILRNTGPSGHWLGIVLKGTGGNSMAIGARVTVSSGGKTQVREVSTGGSVLSASDPRLLFGLGTASQVDYVEIRWPTGAVERHADVAAQQYHTYVEAETAR